MASISIFSLYFLIFAIFLLHENFERLRLQLLRSAVILSAFIWITTELFSYSSTINQSTLIATWVSVNCLTLLYLLYVIKNNNTNVWQQLKTSFKSKKEWINDKPKKIVFTLTCLIFGLIFVTSIIYPPNTVDVLTYHLPRVAHWIQAGNVDFFPTNIERQVFNNPFSEYIILHLQVLSGTDFSANLVQFFSFILLGLSGSLIAQKLDLDKFGQLLTTFIIATVPIAILQASSAKNDLVVSFFICAFFYFFLTATESNNWFDYLFAGLALGLALLTKGTAYFYCFPIGVFIVFSRFIQRQKPLNIAEIIIKTGFVLLLAILVNSNHFYRNFKLYGNPIQGEQRLQNNKISAPIIASNLARNYAVHLGTNFQFINETGESVLTAIFGANFNSPDSTISRQVFYFSQSFHEDDAGNPFHLILLTAAIFFVFFGRCKNKKNLFLLSFSIIFGFVLFCALLKWNYWVSRVHLPLFMLGGPLIAFLLSSINSRFVYLISSGFLISAALTIALGMPRNLLNFPPIQTFSDSRTEFYFANNTDLAPVYAEAVNYLKNINPDEIGLDLSNDYDNYVFGDFEYPFWVLLKKDFTEKPFLRHIGVDNPSKSLNKSLNMPIWVISTRKGSNIDGTEYEEVWNKSVVRILRKKVD